MKQENKDLIKFVHSWIKKMIKDRESEFLPEKDILKLCNIVYEKGWNDCKEKLNEDISFLYPSNVFFDSFTGAALWEKEIKYVLKE